MRPTSKPSEKVKRGRRRPDLFLTATARVREWFEAEPWRTARELFERLQDEQPGVYPDGQIRTLQRRLKGWRSEMTHRLVRGKSNHEAQTSERTPISERMTILELTAIRD